MHKIKIRGQQPTRATTNRPTIQRKTKEDLDMNQQITRN